MDDIIENDPSRGGEASLWNPSVSSEESTRHSNMSSTILNSGSQTLSQSLLSPRIRIEEARQFNDELVGQDPGAQCDSLRDLGQIVDETLDSLAKQTTSENDHIIRDLDDAITDLHRWRELRRHQLEVELKEIDSSPCASDSRMKDVEAREGGGEAWEQRPETTEEDNDDERASSESHGSIGRHADQEKINSLTHLIESSRSRAVHGRAGFESREEGHSHVEIKDGSDYKSSSHTYMDAKEDMGGCKVEADAAGRRGVFPLRMDRNVSDIIEEQDRRIFSARLEQEIMESDVDQELEYLRKQLNCSTVDDDLDVLIRKMDREKL